MFSPTSDAHIPNSLRWDYGRKSELCFHHLELLGEAAALTAELHIWNGQTTVGLQDHWVPSCRVNSWVTTAAAVLTQVSDAGNKKKKDTTLLSSAALLGSALMSDQNRTCYLPPGLLGVLWSCGFPGQRFPGRWSHPHKAAQTPNQRWRGAGGLSQVSQWRAAGRNPDNKLQNIWFLRN